MNIMFVCHGNICRSPMAEFIFKDMLKKNNLADSFFVSSSATSSEEIYRGKGNPIYPPAKAELQKNNIPVGEKFAIQLKKSDYENYNLFLCMDSANVRNATRIFGGDSKNKVKLLLETKDVADPWYSGNFTLAYNDIFRGCENLLKDLTMKM